MTCRCHMCGRKQASRKKAARNVYILAGHMTDERGVRGKQDKRRAHKLVRRYAKDHINEQRSDE